MDSMKQQQNDNQGTLPSDRILVFFSYARRDQTLRDHLENHLSILKYRGLITTWHAREISAGQEIIQEIDIHLHAAHIILLLISANFLASEYCASRELLSALERHERGEAHVIPVLLRPVLFTGAPFAKLQPLPTNGKPVTRWSDRDLAFVDIARSIEQLVLSLRSPKIPSTVGERQETRDTRREGQTKGSEEAPAPRRDSPAAPVTKPPPSERPGKAPAPARPTQLEKCPFCLAETRAGDNFCLNCGNRLGPGTAASASPQGQPAVGDATLAAPDDWAASMPASGPIWSDGGATIAGPDQSSAYDPYAPTLRGDLIEQPARFIVHSDGGEKLDEYQLKKLEVSIGRATTSDIPLLRDKLTSRRHATVRYENGHYVLRDERSANGTFVNGQQLAELTPHILQDGDRIGIGEHELVFRAYGSASTNVEDLPTIAVPLNPPDLPTFKVPDGTAATMIASGDYSTRDNGTSGEAAFAPPSLSAPASATPSLQPPAQLAPVNQAAGSTAAASNSAPPVTSEPAPSIPVATSYNFPAPPAASPPAPKLSPNTPSASTGVNKDMTSTPPKTDANVTFNRLTSIAQPPLPDMTTLIAAVSTLDSQVAALQEQLHVTQESMRSHDTEVAQAANELRKGVRRVADRMDGTIADVARSREALAWAEISQLLEDVKNNPRDIEYVTRLARKAHELDKIIRIYQNVVQTMAECNSLLRSMIGEDR